MLTLALIGLYFTPTVIASGMGSPMTGIVFLINLLLGWTIIGWFVALIMGIATKTANHH